MVAAVFSALTWTQAGVHADEILVSAAASLRLEPGTRKNLLSNQLVVIVPADSKFALSSPMDLVKADVKRIALAEPSSVPVGVYSREYLTDSGLWDQVKPKVVSARPCLRLNPATSTRALFTKPTLLFLKK